MGIQTVMRSGLIAYSKETLIIAHSGVSRETIDV